MSTFSPCGCLLVRGSFACRSLTPVFKRYLASAPVSEFAIQSEVVVTRHSGQVPSRVEGLHIIRVA